MELIDFLRQYPLIATALAAVFGSLIGSFLNVVILRLPHQLMQQWQQEAREILALPPHSPERLSIAWPASRCPQCQAPLAIRDNIPLLSFAWLRGRCRACRQAISWQYPVVEGLCAVIAAACVWVYGVNLAALLVFALMSTLLVAAWMDAHTTLLPDELTLPLMWLGLLASLQDDWPISSADALIGAAAGYLFLWSIYQAFRLLTGKEGMGYGDFKLLAALGAWLGWQQLPLVIMLSSLVGASVMIASMATGRLQRDQASPFGPYLAAAGALSWCYGTPLMNWYHSQLM